MNQAVVSENRAVEAMNLSGLTQMPTSLSVRSSTTARTSVGHHRCQHQQGIERQNALAVQQFIEQVPGAEG
jgi:hypothetical protein